MVDTEEFLQVKGLMLDTKKFTKEYYEEFGFTEEEFLQAKQEILKEWARKRDESCVRGSAFHRTQELLHLGGKTKELLDLGLDNKEFKTDTSNQIKLGDKGVYPELLLSRISKDKKLRIAGQADLVIIDGKDVYILDYKTSKKIEKKGYFDRKLKKSSKMKYPLNNLDDTNFWHYSLQLSTYAWMIQKIDPEFNIKLLMLIHYDHDGGMTTYECDYLKSDVERMLGFYKKQIEHDEFKNSREKIIF
jgi:ATP-dependent exoDNAse (exonuclease V) beta subunit